MYVLVVFQNRPCGISEPDCSAMWVLKGLLQSAQGVIKCLYSENFRQFYSFM
jgi:hypothetical protein